jgi:hypothetical protein
VADADQSPFPEAAVARLPRSSTDGKSGVLVARAMAYLAIRILFHGRPVPGLAVTFGRTTGEPDDQPEPMEPAATSDDAGIAFFPRLVPAGLYACDIERQPRALVATTEHPAQPHVVVLPVGRPFVDVGDQDEFEAPEAG